MSSTLIKAHGEAPLEVVIAGGGVAGLEAMIALHRLAGPRVRVELRWRGPDDGPGTKSKEYHSVFLWKDDGKVYLVASDNEELHDVDIFDVSNPRSPKAVAEYDMASLFPQILGSNDATSEPFCGSGGTTRQSRW